MKKILMYASALVLAVALTSCGRDEAPKAKKEKVEEPSKGVETPKKGDETPDNGTPRTGTPGGGTPDNGNPGGGAPDNGKPDGENPGDETPDNGNPDAGNDEGIVSADGKYTLSKDKTKLISWNDEDATQADLTTDEDLRNVKVIGTSAFSKSSKITSVKLPEGLQRIENLAFASIRLTSVELPETLVYIGDSAFNGSRLTELRIPDSVTHIGMSAFFGNRLTSLVIGTGMKEIGRMAFGSNSLTSVTINTVAPPKIGSGIFRQRNHSVKVDIFVPAASVSAYQKAWTAYADQIKAQN
ncbi:MAG: leucine-rich repeat domain-containing protein [Flavobacteriaceae bacterium]|nr:leucine-rich repeat domain-containing protein [Flavobacteriaceae bacterium]